MLARAAPQGNVPPPRYNGNMGRRLGQHFLMNRTDAAAIVRALSLGSGDTVVEIGPGHGELTWSIVGNRERFLRSGIHLVAIERDQALADRLRRTVSTRGLAASIRIIRGDAVSHLPGIWGTLGSPGAPAKLVGNIPYYLTGRLLRTISTLEPLPAATVLTLQREVAERICAAPPKMNLLAASVQSWCIPEIIHTIPRERFRPQPKVDSAAVRFVPIPSRPPAERNAYHRLIRALFKQPRKTIRNNLRELLDSRELQRLTLECPELNLEHRPGNVAIETIKKLALIVYTMVR